MKDRTSKHARVSHPTCGLLPSEARAHRRGGIVRIGSNPMATLIKAPKRDLHDYISESSEHAHVRAGFPLPFGTQETEGGVNFAIFSRDASRVQLELFDHPEDAVPNRVTPGRDDHLTRVAHH